jgi:transposase
MKCSPVWVGLDVHKETISVAVLVGETREPRPPVTIPNRTEEIRRLFGRLRKEGDVRACYEAGSCGYEVYRQLAAMKIACDVVAPALIPVRAGDRVKTDRRDASKIARLHRAGELTAIRVPTDAQEAVRDVLRYREDLREDVVRERQRVLKFLSGMAASSTTASTGRSDTGPGSGSSASWIPRCSSSSTSTSHGSTARSRGRRRSTRKSRGLILE